MSAPFLFGRDLSDNSGLIGPWLAGNQEFTPLYKTILVGLAILGLSVALSITTYKMLEFRETLAGLANADWERKLDGAGMYVARRIVFFGDSQIAGWPMATSFGAMPILNRGVNGDWATKAVTRFARDVLAHRPDTVVLLIGTNDIGHRLATADIANAVSTMASRAQQAGARVIICSVLPVRGEYVSNHPAEQIAAVNAAFQRIEGSEFVDVGAAVADATGLLDERATVDGLHPNAAGYLRMTSRLLPVLLGSEGAAGHRASVPLPR